ncbi:flavin monoamine oxidase family protein [Pseudomonas sp. NPDC089741]|uniref:flavin monoamine oxidase family protein n=1 Tax=Pseudomonas sp. NPDC089741 TaxID=3364470 RepID=UPI00380F1B62
MNTVKVAIIGGGLSGLYTAYLLSQMNVEYQLFEARDRLGGRILSTPGPGSRHDLGPAWMWPDFQPRMAALVEELEIATFAQHTEGATLMERSSLQPPRRMVGWESGNTSMRIHSGVQQLIDALATKVPAERILLNCRITKVTLRNSRVFLMASDGSSSLENMEFTHVISAMPLRLMAQSIEFEPPTAASRMAQWAETPTWMAAHAKYVALYSAPFWRAAGLSGSAQSHIGPMVEIHDACDPAGSAALFGFIGLPASVRKTMDQGALLAACNQQMGRLFGTAATTPLAHYIKDWAWDDFTAADGDRLATQVHHTGRTVITTQDVWSDVLLVSGTEASLEHNGYMEGALDAAQVAVNRLHQIEIRHW